MSRFSSFSAPTAVAGSGGRLSIGPTIRNVTGVRSLRPHTPLLTFGLSVLAVYAAAFAIVPRLAQLERADLVAGGLTVDLTLLVPLLYYLLLVRRRGWPAVTILPVFLISVALAGRLIPETQHQVLNGIYFVAGVAELVLVGIVVHKSLQLRRGYRRQAATGLDFYAALRESARSTLGPIAGNVLAFEVAVFYYALFGWRRAPGIDSSSFSYHRTVGYGAVVAAVIVAVCVETLGVHLLLRQWSSVAAWILTGLSVYALVWLIGDTHAIRLRPIRLSDTTLHLRLGLRWTIDVPVESIERIGAPAEGALPRRTPGYLKLVMLGAPNCRIELSSPVAAAGPYGLSRQVTTIDLHADEPELLELAVENAAESSRI